jgi:hypothetical protein
MNYEKKYLKYKNKYLSLKQKFQKGGIASPPVAAIPDIKKRLMWREFINRRSNFINFLNNNSHDITPLDILDLIKEMPANIDLTELRTTELIERLSPCVNSLAGNGYLSGLITINEHYPSELYRLHKLISNSRYINQCPQNVFNNSEKNVIKLMSDHMVTYPNHVFVDYEDEFENDIVNIELHLLIRDQFKDLYENEYLNKFLENGQKKPDETDDLSKLIFVD